MSKLNEKQKAFADYYIESLNAYESAKRAGYSEAYAKSQSYKLLENVGICRILAENGADPTIKDRMRASELLGKRYRMWVDKVEANVNQQVIFEGEELLED